MATSIPCLASRRLIVPDRKVAPGPRRPRSAVRASVRTSPDGSGSASAAGSSLQRPEVCSPERGRHRSGVALCCPSRWTCKSCDAGLSRDASPVSCRRSCCNDCCLTSSKTDGQNAAVSPDAARCTGGAPPEDQGNPPKRHGDELQLREVSQANTFAETGEVRRAGSRRHQLLVELNLKAEELQRRLLSLENICLFVQNKCHSRRCQADASGSHDDSEVASPSASEGWFFKPADPEVSDFQVPLGEDGSASQAAAGGEFSSKIRKLRQVLENYRLGLSGVETSRYPTAAAGAEVTSAFPEIYAEAQADPAFAARAEVSRRRPRGPLARGLAPARRRVRFASFLQEISFQVIAITPCTLR